MKVEDGSTLDSRAKGKIRLQDIKTTNPIAVGDTVLVNVDNFVRAETERMLLSTQAEAGGINRFGHNRMPTPVEHQPVIRMNRDTLYSFAAVDISEGATLTIPDGGARYRAARLPVA